MEALSPLSTNLPVKPKANVNRVKPDQEAAAAAAAQKAAPPKHQHHARPPPPVVTEPGEDGERYATGPFLGKGGFAICYEGKLLRNGRVFAMKVVKSEMNQRKMEEKVRECANKNKREMKTIDRVLVSNRAPDPFEDATSEHCPIPSCVRI